MATEVRTDHLQNFDTLRTNGVLEISPSIQRKSVWTEKSKMLLIDSIIRGVPIGAITLYADDEGGYNRFEVIDGKQRLSTVLDFIDDKFFVAEEVVDKVDDETIANVGREHAEKIFGRKWSELETPERQIILQYRIPVFEIKGDRGQAVQTFTRMNQNSYVLEPQEIRNAIYANSFFLKEVSRISDLITFPSSDRGDVSALLSMGVVSEQGWTRMQDLQFISEILVLALAGQPTNRRDKLNDYYGLYAESSSPSAGTCTEKANLVAKAFNQIYKIFNNGVSLQAYHFPANCENDMYAIVGAFLEYGPLSQPLMNKKSEELRDWISEFRRQVQLAVSGIRSQTVNIDSLAPDVQSYAKTFLGGQQNSKARRKERQDVFLELLTEVVGQGDDQGFTSSQRALIWASSTDKLCGRCHRAVKYPDFHAGHIESRALGGKSVPSNGRVEHATCNLQAGAD